MSGKSIYNDFINLQNRKRTILVVDDEQINREFLRTVLSEQYDLLFAENGKQALDILCKNKEGVSLVLLDAVMPDADGFAVLKAISANEELKSIPVIILTGEKDYDAGYLQLGACDFISKPFDPPAAVLARAARIIELSESNYIIKTTGFDKLTGLFTPEYFYQVTDQYDKYDQAAMMDAVWIDVIHFNLINEIYGHEAGSDMLKQLGDLVKEYTRKKGGFACRREGDVFLLYCPHGNDYNAMLKHFQKNVVINNVHSAVKLRIGIYPYNPDDAVNVRTKFDRAKAARDSIRNSAAKDISYYDCSLHKKQLFAQRLIDELDYAIESEQFAVYYQPKYNITGGKPVLSSAEALIRWQHPHYGMIEPGVFIELFEKNGLISRLDRYVWRKSIEQVSRWRAKFGVTVPVSFNVSRIDLYDNGLVPFIISLTEEYGVSPSDCFIEITESAYTENVEQIIEKTGLLRKNGFRVEMDDFGAGYSSLNMLAEIPIDILKLDMKFVRNIVLGEKNVTIMKLVMELKNNFSIPVVAEGVETEDQYNMLKTLGCDIIQGYYFSPPVPADEFERFIKEGCNLC